MSNVISLLVKLYVKFRTADVNFIRMGVKLLSAPKYITQKIDSSLKIFLYSRATEEIFLYSLYFCIHQALRKVHNSEISSEHEYEVALLFI